MTDQDDQDEEKAKRLQPTKETIRHLFALSGNLCAFPNCDHLMISATGTFIGQICHIEAAEEGGERFNKNMSNEERRAPSNLMLMCYKHHQETNNVEVYKVEDLQKMKANHERLFSGAASTILGELRDWDKSAELILPINFVKFYEVLNWPTKQSDFPSFAIQFEQEVIKSLRRLAQAPLQLRAYLETLSKRSVLQEDRNQGSKGAKLDSGDVLIADVQLGLRLTDTRFDELNALLGHYRLGEVNSGDGYDEHTISIYDIEGMPFYPLLVRFANECNIPSETFFHALDFSSLQSFAEDQDNGQP